MTAVTDMACLCEGEMILEGEVTGLTFKGLGGIVVE